MSFYVFFPFNYTFNSIFVVKSIVVLCIYSNIIKHIVY